MPELRKDPIIGRWVIIATERAKRPDQFASGVEKEELAPGEKEALAKYAGKALTLLVKPKILLEHLAQEGLIGLRVIDHPLMQELADAASVPLTATSANVAGQESCYTTDCILKSFPGRIDETTYNLSLGCILDGGALSKSEPSTIAKLVDGKIEVIRQGALAL